MSKREWIHYLSDIDRSVDKIINYTEGVGEEQFRLDERTFDAVMRNLQIIG